MENKLHFFLLHHNKFAFVLRKIHILLDIENLTFLHDTTFCPAFSNTTCTHFSMKTSLLHHIFLHTSVSQQGIPTAHIKWPKGGTHIKEIFTFCQTQQQHVYHQKSCLFHVWTTNMFTEISNFCCLQPRTSKETQLKKLRSLVFWKNVRKRHKQ